MDIVILGAGPAGLSAGYLAAKRGYSPLVLEKGKGVGGLSRTIDHNGFLFDIGGHRFFTDSQEVKALWFEILGGEFLKCRRQSRIYYRNKYFDYPLKPLDALLKLGQRDALSVFFSYLRSKISPCRNEANFEEWMCNRFGEKIYEIFFKSYTEKVWGIPCTVLRADWAAQRIKSLSWSKLLLNSFGLPKHDGVRSLIDQFHYPRLGPGQMWEKAAERIGKLGGRVLLDAEVTEVVRNEKGISSVCVRNKGRHQIVEGDEFISTLPLRDLIRMLNPSPPSNVLAAAAGLKYRDFFTVGLIIDRSDIFPDNWIYINTPDVHVSRIQNFKNWSRDMVPDPGLTTLGLEYFCFQSDEIWRYSDGDLIELAKEDVEKLGFAEPGQIIDGTVGRAPDAYPIYDETYKERVRIIIDFISSIPNLQTVGRNGLHRYNNQDHSILSAMEAIQNLPGKPA